MSLSFIMLILMHDLLYRNMKNKLLGSNVAGVSVVRKIIQNVSILIVEQSSIW